MIKDKDVRNPFVARIMLENEKYRGNSVATAPTMSDAPKDLPRRRYMLSMHHEGIISSEQFDDAQKEKGATQQYRIR